jgi:hypothetical protein
LVSANTPRKVHWAWIGILIAVVVLIAGALVVLVALMFSTVPVIIINDTAADVIIPDCGSDLVSINPGADVVVDVNRSSRACGVDAERGGKEVLVGCLNMPNPISANMRFRVSAMQPVQPGASCP